MHFHYYYAFIVWMKNHSPADLGLYCFSKRYQGLHRLENYLNTGVFLEKSLKIKSALKSTGKSLKSLEKSLCSAVFCRT